MRWVIACILLACLSSPAIASCSELKLIELKIERERQSTVLDSLRLLGGLPFGLLSWLDRRSESKIRLADLELKRSQLIDKLKAEQESAKQNLIIAADRYLSDRQRLELVEKRLQTLIATWRPGRSLDSYFSLKQRAEDTRFSLVSSAKELLRVKEFFSSLIACPSIADPPKLTERYEELITDAQRLVNESEQQAEKQTQADNRQGQEITISIHAIDGDTIKIGQKRYRLACIDAPESDQALGSEAREFLRSKLLPPITLQPVGRDRYGRPIVFVRSGNELINLAIVKAGLAYYFRSFECPLSNQFDAAEKLAKQSRRGVWSRSGLIPPWVWRRQ